ncbi:hypothetical protein J2795_001000 [Chryseobacterium bernardetii]|uniref:DUF305 family protein family protein n=4 Tax=Chryseobacterium TaxID=59732 RepID=A0A543ELA6_9FLAO|nr:MULTISPECIES: DUF305 domain-containing protein [Chryseobacterium]MDR6368762.1 hypothetical protein [Chryseobacterium vietnamense]MDR6440315.1 hypothetical protein [Chryseobacterium bernardetii]MDR6460361.1 hypothetical protein [Chryseobacterium vietnamense]TQM22374.1 DUF305 family protein family protein [Chryseobacterium aquifrigidense]
MENREHNHGIVSSGEVEKHSKHSSSPMYGQFVLMALVMFCAMYILMYAMIDSLKNLISNINNLYMALLMTSVMLLIELWIMRKMYTSRAINWAIVVIAIASGIFSWFGIREQMNVDDRQFVKSMIPHHAAAILMAEKAHLTDPQLITLQKNILKTQSEEIKLMKHKLREFEKR